MRLYDYAASANCYKVRLLLSLLDRPFDRVPVDIFAGETLSPEFERLNPARETPVLELDGGERLVQSNAILWYLAEGTPLVPGDALGRPRVVQWLIFEQEWIVRGAGAARFFVLTGRDPELVSARRAHGRRALELLDAGLARSPWAAGDEPTIADVALYAYTHVAPDAGLDLDPHPNVLAWLERVEALPRFMNDLVPYPANARPGVSRSIYDRAPQVPRPPRLPAPPREAHR